MLPELLISLLTTFGASSAQALGRALLTTEPTQRAIRTVTDLYPTIRKSLSKALRRWLSDDDVLEALVAVTTGSEPADVTTAMVDALLHHCDHYKITDFQREEAERIVAEFWHQFAVEITKSDTALHRLETIVRYEGAKTRDLIRRTSPSTYLSPPPAHVVQRDAAGSSDAEHQQWHDQVDNANRLLDARKVRSALTTYRQILEDLTHIGSISSISFRLHANIGTCLLLLGEWEQAEVHFKKARDFAPDKALPLCQLAQVELRRGRHTEASYYAEEAITRDPEDTSAWLIRLQSDPPPDLGTVPTHVRNEAIYHMIRARRAFDRGDYPNAIQLASEALAKSDRSVMELIDIAEMLYVADSARTASDSGQLVREDVADLCSEAIDLIEFTEWPQLAARALTLRGTCRAADAISDAKADLASAMALAPHQVGPHVAFADLLLGEGKYDQALSILQRVPSSISDFRVHLLRARILTYRDPKDGEIERELRTVLPLLPSGTRISPFLLDLADVATRARLPTLATELLAELPEEIESPPVRALRARLAAVRGDGDVASLEYRAALAEAGAEESPFIACEFAAFLAAAGSHDEAADILSDVSFVEAPVELHPMYAEVLIRGKRWVPLAKLILHHETATSLPAWVLDAASILALQRDDLAGAEEYLATMKAHGSARVVATIRLAYTLLRADRASDALCELSELGASELTPDQHESVVRLYFHAGAFEDAAQAAYRSWRIAPTRRSETILVMVFLSSPSNLTIFQDLERVAADTSVRLQDVEGQEEVSFTITNDPPLPGQHDEIQMGSGETKPLLGKTVDDLVTLRPEDFDPVEYRIIEIKPALVTAAQRAMQRMATHPGGDERALQTLRLGQPESVRFFTSAISMLHRREALNRELFRVYHAHRCPLGLLAERAGVSVRDVYLHLNLTEGEACYVESGSTESLGVADRTAREAEEIIVSVSGLLTLQRLELLPLLPQMYERVLAPPSLRVELRRLRQHARTELGRDKVGRMATGSTGLQLIEVPVEALEREYKELDELVTFVSGKTTAVARQLEAMEESSDGLREMIGEAEADALLGAVRGRPLYADDVGLRAQARWSFSTHALLGAACERGLLSTDELLEATTRLVLWGHTFVPIPVTLPYAGFKVDGLLLGPHLRAVLRRVTELPTSDDGLGVAAYFVGQMLEGDRALPPFQPVVWQTLDLVYSGPDRAARLAKFDRAVSDCLRGAPISHQRYLSERQAFLAAKRGK